MKTVLVLHVVGLSDCPLRFLLAGSIDRLSWFLDFSCSVGEWLYVEDEHFLRNHQELGNLFDIDNLKGNDYFQLFPDEVSITIHVL